MEKPIIWYEPIIKKELVDLKDGTLPRIAKHIVYKVHMRGEDREPPREPLE